MALRKMMCLVDNQVEGRRGIELQEPWEPPSAGTPSQLVLASDKLVVHNRARELLRPHAVGVGLLQAVGE